MKKKIKITKLPKAQDGRNNASMLIDPSYFPMWSMNNTSTPFGSLDVSGMPMGELTTGDITSGMTALGDINQKGNFRPSTKNFNAQALFGPGSIPSFPEQPISVTPLLYDEDKFNDPYGPLTESSYYANVAQQNLLAPKGTYFTDTEAYAPGYRPKQSTTPTKTQLEGAGYVAPLLLAGTDVFANIGKARKKANARDNFYTQSLADNLYMSKPEGYSGDRGDYTLNYGTGLNFRPDEAVYGQFGKVAQYGGQMKRKIKITGLPSAAYGGTQNKVAVDELYPATDLIRMKNSGAMFSGEDMNVRQYIPEVPREIATVEAERGETIVTPGTDGIPNMYKIGGQRHSNGGTPIQAGQGDFIFSDTKDMKIKDPVLLESFGMKYKKGGYTPADISKKFNLNNPVLQKTLNDPKADHIAKATAERMMDSNISQLGKLALIQEGRKGFPQGPPSISMAYMQKVGLDPAMFMPDVMTPQDATVAMGRAQYGGLGNMGINAFSGASNLPLGYTPPKPAIKTDALFGTSSANSASSQQPFVVPPQQRPARSYSGSGSGSLYKDFFTYDQGALSDLRSRDINIDLPEVGINIDITPGMQGTRESGTFGTQDWGSGDYFADFKRRNAWYFDENADFDPSSAEDVYDFQNKFNDKLFNEAKASGYTDDEARAVVTKLGFEKTEIGDRNPRGTDKKFGQYTWSRSLPNITPKTKKSNNPPDEKGEYPQEDLDVNNRKKRNDFYIQDLLNYRQALGDRLGINKYMPYRAAIPTPALMEPTFYDPSRELAATAEQANIASQALSQFATPQAYNARQSEVQGRALANVANTLGRYNNLNVGVANEFERYNSALINDFNLKNALSMQDYYDKTVIANQQYDNAKRVANNRITNQATNAITNRAMTQVMNELYPDYSIFPLSGGFMRFTPSGRQTSPSTTGSYADNLNAVMKELSGVPGFNEMSAKDRIKAAQDYLDSTNPGGSKDPRIAMLKNYMNMMQRDA